MFEESGDGRRGEGRRGEWRMGEGDGVEYYVMENSILANFI